MCWSYVFLALTHRYINPDTKVHGANMGPIWGQQDPGGPHIGPMNIAIWEWTAIINPCPNFNRASVKSPLDWGQTESWDVIAFLFPYFHNKEICLLYG